MNITNFTSSFVYRCNIDGTLCMF